MNKHLILLTISISIALVGKPGIAKEDDLDAQIPNSVGTLNYQDPAHSNTHPHLYSDSDYRPENQPLIDHSEIRIKTIVCNKHKFHLAYQATWGWSNSERILYICPVSIERESKACRLSDSVEHRKCYNKAITFYQLNQSLIPETTEPAPQNEDFTDIGTTD